MIGLNIWFTPHGAQAESFPSFGADFISDYDRSNNTHRLHVRDAFRDDMCSYVEQCEARGHQLVGFHFDYDRDEPVTENVPAFEIAYQSVAFFENSDDKTWKGNEHRRVEIDSTASVLAVAKQLLFVDQIATVLKKIRPGMDWRKVLSIDKYKRQFWRLVTQPEHAFLASQTIVNGHVAFSWVAAAAEPPDDLFFDDLEFEGFYPLIVSRGVAQKLEREFGTFPLIPVLGCNTQTGRAVIRICELLKARMNRGLRAG